MPAKPRVFVSRRIPAVGLELISPFCDAEIWPDQLPPPSAVLHAKVRDCEGLISLLTDRIDDELLDAAGLQLRVVANFAVGFDNVDVPACTRRGVIVSNTPDVLTQATAELTIALLLALVRRVAEGDRLVRRGEEWIWAPNMMLGRGLASRTLGLVGFGRIGQAVARLAEAHGMNVVHTSRSGGLPLDELLRGADVVSLHVPLSAETHHLIDERALALMKPTAVLVNTSRGPIVDEAALARALAEGRIAGAALDVFEREPEVTDALLRLDNVVLTPHLGSATLETREAMGMLCVNALRAVLIEHRPPENALNPEAWA
jgi:glyoxylate reductase